MATRTRSSKKSEQVSAEDVDIETENDSEEEEEEEEEGRGSSKRLRQNEEPSMYEHIRDQRMKENQERMQKLGLLKLSQKLKTQHQNPQRRPKKNIDDALPSRRSSRIMTLEPVNYAENKAKGREEGDSSSKDSKDNIEIFIPEGENPEFYTEEQEKLLGDSDTIWELGVDGCDVDGSRMYDSIRGETCHQCRQKTLCQHTNCNRCELSQGQLCGDCLYTRYGENLLEAIENPKWTCPSCRGICNCTRCRKANGWMPTGNIYHKVSKLGFKSVAHYLIQTRRTDKSLEEGSGAENVAEEIPQIPADTDQNRAIRTRRGLRRS
ncbi:uncharacterized protein LOC107469575 [Arachis duranensis]|uniref:Uncharacterized protein LOC107469575 n=1 Tax=Arachis duranensis TaxID=130453 RepID=A0A6P4BLZ6_ARADU|nr:uncharacterized protein LOC107469575 [Arachis duranensis]